MIADDGFDETGREECVISSLLKISFIFLQYFRACGGKRKALQVLQETSLSMIGVCIPSPQSVVRFQTSLYS